MLTTLKQMRTQQQNSVARNRRRDRKTRPAVEGLEQRQVLSGGLRPIIGPVGPTPKQIVVVVGATNLSVSGTATYGGAATLTATLTHSFSFSPVLTPVAGQPVQFTLNNKVVGTMSTNSNGVATLTGVSISGYGAGTYSGARGVRRQLDLWCATGTGTLTVNAAKLTVTAANESMAYGGSVPALAYKYSGLVNGNTSAASPAPWRPPPHRRAKSAATRSREGLWPRPATTRSALSTRAR